MNRRPTAAGGFINVAHRAMTQAILTDIEGTTTPISFVTQVLYPYARTRLPGFLRERAQDVEVARISAEVQASSWAMTPSRSSCRPVSA